jgi:hypothetical protein
MDTREDELEEVMRSKLTKMLVSNSSHFSSILVDIVEAAHGENASN